jgi:large subunit ribosomal protein L31e
MAKKIEEKMLYEREYIVPLRRGWLKVPEYKRGNKAVKTLKEFIARHMKIYDRDLRKVKLDVNLNNEIRFRGIRKPLSKIKVKAKKFAEYVTVELVDIPEKVKFAILRKERIYNQIKKVKEKKPEEKPEEKAEQKEEAKEKEQASREEGMQHSKQEALDKKHAPKVKQIPIQRKVMEK